jgi:hypothetical protein
MAVVISYLVLVSAVEWLRIKAGVASDTCTPIDVIAWLSCIFTVTVIAGSFVYGLRRSTGVLGTIGVLLILGVCIVLHLNESLVFDGFSAVFGFLTLPVLAWDISVGLAAGWALSTNQSRGWKVWPAIAVFVGALISLAIVFYPADRYFVSIWGNG